MKVNPVGFLTKLFNNKKFLLAFSLILAIVFWVIIDISENPSREITVSDLKINLLTQTDDNGNKLSVMGKGEYTVSVTVEGPGYIVSNVTAPDITVSVASYAKVTKPGQYTLDISATVGKSGCSVIRVTPPSLTVEYDYSTSADIPIEYDMSEFQKQVSTDCEIYKSVLKNNADGTELETIKLTGPSEVLASIEKAVVTPLGNLDINDQNYEHTLQFFTAEGTLVSDEYLEYNREMTLRVVIYKTAEVGIVATFDNMPQYYSGDNTVPYKLGVFNDVSNSYAEISKVTIKGTVSAVEELMVSGLKLSPIDFMKITPTSTEFFTSFMLPDGVKVADGTKEQEIKVTLTFGRLSTSSVSVNPDKIEYRNLGAGLSASNKYKQNIKIVICGNAQVLKKINAGNCKVYVDCTGVSSATTEARPIKVELGADFAAWIISTDPSEITVDIG